MRILITNDDGIHAEGLLPFAKWAQKLGEVIVAAPMVEQSGKSHGIEIHKPFRVEAVELAPGIRGYSVDSTPADCVRYALLGRQEKVDFVISGINKGLNVGKDIMYSGTVAAVFEASALGIPAMAVSADPKIYDAAVEHMDRIWTYITQRDLYGKHDLYNVNIPVEAGDIRITRQGGPYYSDDFVTKDGWCTPVGKPVYAPRGDLSLDTEAVLTGGFISIMPLALERTERRVFEALQTE